MLERVTVSCLEAGIYQLRLDDPATGNRLGIELAAEVSQALTQLEGEAALKVLLLAGSAEVFSAGGDRGVLDGLAGGQLDEGSLFALPTQLLQFPLPVIAVLEGHAVGGGLMLALCCDLLVASQTSRYGLNFTDLGFTPGMGATTLLPALVAPAFANEMLFTARLYRGTELRDRGLFNYVVAAEQVPTVALDLARRIAPKPRRVLTMLKDALALPRRHALQEARLREPLMQRVCFGDPATAQHIQENYLA